MSSPVDLSVSVGSTTLRNPILGASGTVAFGKEILSLGAGRFGGIVLKTVTPDAREGHPPPRVAETPAGMINAIGLENPGLDALCRERLPLLSGTDCAVIVSIYAEEADGLCAMASRLAGEALVTAVEVNLSCPNLKRGITASHDPGLTHEFISAARIEGGKPLWAKVSPDCPDIVAVARAAADAGAEAVVVANTYTSTAVDWRGRRPLIGFGTGGLSGPAVKPLSLYRVALVAGRTDIPVVASGGAFSAEDVLQFLSVGASAVQVGTVNLVDPAGVSRIPDEMAELLVKENIASVEALIGRVDIFRGSENQ